MALNITGVIVVDSSSEDENVVVNSSASEDSGVGSGGSRMDGAENEPPSVPVFNYRDPSFLLLLFNNSHDLVMLTHGRICMSVDDGMALALATRGGPRAMAYHIANCCLQVSLCCWCCTRLRLGVVCYTHEQVVYRVNAAVREGLGLCPNRYSMNRYLIRRIEYGGFTNDFPNVDCYCDCC